MNSTERFRRFAAECEDMARLSPSRQNKAVWTGLAERWVRCAKLSEQREADAESLLAARRRRSAHAAHH